GGGGGGPGPRGWGPGGGGHGERRGGFAKAGITADEQGRAAHQPAAGDAVELGDAGDAALGLLGRGSGEVDELEPAAALAAEAFGRRLACRLLDDRVPLTAGLAAPAPARIAGAAGLADIVGGEFGHSSHASTTYVAIGATTSWNFMPAEAGIQGDCLVVGPGPLELRLTSMPRYSGRTGILIGPSARPWMNCST